eukprot:COSAG02_NODE_313_length_24939_cov_470.394485_24_plen_55_part_00
MDLGHLYRYYNPCERCSKYKKLYEEEKQKYEDLKSWTEKLLSSNKELLDQIKNK